MAKEIRLEFPEEYHRAGAQALVEEFFAAGESLYGSGGLYRMPYSQWLTQVRRHSQGEKIPRGRVPNTTYFGMVENKIVGVVNLRHRLNKNYSLMGGHIGYSIAPSQRGKGYGTAQLLLALEEAKSKGISQALITCALDNTASAATVLSVGGVLQREAVVDGEVLQYYKITL